MTDVQTEKKQKKEEKKKKKKKKKKQEDLPHVSSCLFPSTRLVWLA